MLIVAVAILTTLLSCGIAAQAVRQRSHGLVCLSLWMVSLAVSAWAILAFGTGRGPSPLTFLILALMSTPAGPLLYGYVLNVTRGRRLHLLWLLPFVLHLAAALAFGTALNRVVSLTTVIWMEYAFLIGAWAVWLGSGPGGGRIAAAGVLTAATALQLANLSQSAVVHGLLPPHQAFKYAPFAVVCLWALVGVAMAIAESAAFRRLAPALVPAPARGDEDLFRRITGVMEEAQPWRDLQFDLEALARRGGTHPNAVSRALSRVGRTTFYDYVNGYRLREAERLLSDPRESRTKVEALGLQAGFRARSTFFKLFRQYTGQTPSEYRAAHVPGAPPGPASESGL
jgi:AraC-like DNA-binding protein